jgi:hypothetical protein
MAGKYRTVLLLESPFLVTEIASFPGIRLAQVETSQRGLSQLEVSGG